MRSQVSGVPPVSQLASSGASLKVWLMGSERKAPLTAVPGVPPPGAARSTELAPKLENEERLSSEVLAPTQIRFAPA